MNSLRLPPVRAAAVGFAPVWMGLAAFGFAAGMWALWQRVVGGEDRADIPELVNAILFGDVSLLLGLLCLAGMGWACRRPCRWWLCAGLLVGASGALLAAVLSVTRSVWLVLPVGLLVLYLGQGRYARPPLQVLMGVLMAGFVAMAVALPQTGVADRLVKSVRDVEKTWSGGCCTRLNLYHAVLREVILERPLLGHGDGRLRPVLKALAAEGRVNEGLARNPKLWHAHNDALDALVRRGLVGLLALMALYLVPLVWFALRLRDPDPALRSLAVAGTLVPVAYMGFGLTYTMFAYPLAVALYFGLLGVFWCLWSGGLPRPALAKGQGMRDLTSTRS